jgi:hypothetical protein
VTLRDLLLTVLPVAQDLQDRQVIKAVREHKVHKERMVLKVLQGLKERQGLKVHHRTND